MLWKRLCDMKYYVLYVLASIFMIVGIYTVYDSLQDKGVGEGFSVLWTDEMEAFGDELCSGLSDDKEKVSAIYGWIAENIRYDYTADMVYQYFDYGRTIRTKKGVCFDYATLFAYLCRTQGIPCYILDGYNRENFSYKHTWNRVFYDGVWWNLDVTFDAIQTQKNTGVRYGFRDIGTDLYVDDDEYVITRVY